MKKNIHPSYNFIIFEDNNNKYRFLTRSTLSSAEKAEWHDGNTYPLVRLDVTSASYDINKKIVVDTAGRIGRFKSKWKQTQ